MANPRIRAKSGMRGHGTERWMKRHEAKLASRKQRRKEDRREANEGA